MKGKKKIKKDNYWYSMSYGIVGGMVGGFFVILLSNWIKNIGSCGRYLIWCGDFLALFVTLLLTFLITFMRDREDRK